MPNFLIPLKQLIKTWTDLDKVNIDLNNKLVRVQQELFDCFVCLLQVEFCVNFSILLCPKAFFAILGEELPEKSDTLDVNSDTCWERT